jgi:hypothetical protein
MTKWTKSLPVKSTEIDPQLALCGVDYRDSSKLSFINGLK